MVLAEDEAPPISIQNLALSFSLCLNASRILLTVSTDFWGWQFWTLRPMAAGLRGNSL